MNLFHWKDVEQLKGLERKKFLEEIRIIKYLYINGSGTNAEICQHLKISAPKSFSKINELVSIQMAEKKGRGESVGGRRPDLYGLKDDSLYVLAMDMGKEITQMAILDSKNRNITGSRYYSISLDNRVKTGEILHKCADDLIKESGIDTSRLVAVGISMPGLVDSMEGVNYTYLNFCDKSLKTFLEEKFGCPVFIENDAKARALAEFRFGLAKGRNNVLVILMDAGIGMGLILDGKLYRGSSGFAGEFGHIPILENGELCNCGKHGCLETLASGNSLERMASEGIKSGKPSRLAEINKIDAAAVIDAAFSGDQFAIGLLSNAGFHLGKGMSVLIQLFNPELIILSGGMTKAAQFLIPGIQQSLNIYAMHQLSEKTMIRVSEMDQNAGLMGAVAVVMDHIFENFRD